MPPVVWSVITGNNEKLIRVFINMAYMVRVEEKEGLECSAKRPVIHPCFYLLSLPAIELNFDEANAF